MEISKIPRLSMCKQCVSGSFFSVHEQESEDEASVIVPWNFLGSVQVNVEQLPTLCDHNVVRVTVTNAQYVCGHTVGSTGNTECLSCFVEPTVYEKQAHKPDMYNYDSTIIDGLKLQLQVDSVFNLFLTEMLHCILR